MNAALAAVPSPMLDRILRDFEAAQALLPGGDVARAARRRAAQQLSQFGWPSIRDEQWRYANLRAYERVAAFRPAGLDTRGALAATDQPAAAGLSAEQLSELPPVLPGFERLLYVDGVRFTPAAGAPLAGAPVASAPAAQPTATGAAAANPSAATSALWPADQRLGLLCDMFASDAAVLRLSGEAAIEILFITTEHAAGAACYPRLVVELEPGSQVKLVERHLGSPVAPTMVCANITVDLSRGAQLLHYRLQQCGQAIAFADTLAARLAEDARYEVRQVAIGAGSARTSAQVRLAGRSAHLSWQAIAVGRGEQVHDTALKVEHLAPATRTDEVFRGIADERARVAFSGHIHIDSSGVGSQARQSLRGLIEGTGAEIDLRPRLEISTDEVQAQHGATTGRLDENLLFYLLSRGVDRRTARALLKWAFLSDVLREIELPQLRVEAERGAAGQLPDIMAIGALV